MSIDPANLDSHSLPSRLRALFFKPRETWADIAREPVEVDELYTRIAIPLAAFSALCSTVGLVFFRWGVGGFYVHLNPVQALISGGFQFASLLLSIYVMARVTDALLPRFGLEANRVQAHKLSVYASTAALLSGVFALHPALGLFGLVGLYSLFLLFVGLTPTTGVGDDKRWPLFGAIIGITLAIMLAVSLPLNALRGFVIGTTASVMTPFGQQRPVAEAQTELAVPGGEIDVRMLEQQARRYGPAAPSVAPSRLEQFLPQTLPSGFTRTALSSTDAGGVNHARAEYQNGDARMNVMIARIEGAEAAAFMANAANMQANRRDADGFSRTQTLNGRIYSEQVSESQRSASYAVMGNGVMLVAEGTGLTADEVRAAVETIGVQRLEQHFGN